MPRIKLVLAYVGTAYHGWQTQARKTGPEMPTIQSLLESAVFHILGEPTHVHGAGRTDSGVHADAQVAHMDVPETRASLNWQLALNTLLPRDIRVVEASVAPPGFHAQRSAVRKTYEYRLWLSRHYTPPKMYPFVWACGPVDVARMDAAAPLLVGTRDFASLRNAGTDLVSTVRTVTNISHNPTGTLAEDSLELVWTFEADGFLKQMVRNSMGLLVAVGQGKLEPETIPGILAGCDRRLAPVTAPPQGLTLKKVWYESIPPRFTDPGRL